MKTTSFKKLRAFPPGVALSVIVCAGSLQAATVIVTDSRIGGGVNRTTNVTGGTLGSAPANGLPTLTYTITGIDLTSVGGSDSEQIIFTVGYTQSGGTGVQYNAFGNISVTGGNNNMIDPAETLTATLSLSSTTFSGGLSNLSIGFTGMMIGGYGTSDVVDIIHDGGTIRKTFATDTNPFVTFAPSVSFTQDTITADTNLQIYTIEITAIPEPTTALLGVLGLLALLRRRR